MSDQFDLRAGAKAMTPLSSAGQGVLPSSVGGIFSARVTKVLLDDSDKELFQALGGWRSIGAVKAVTFINNNDSDTEIVAYPLDSNKTKYPLENEIILVVNAPNYMAQTSKENYTTQYYYFAIVPGFNAVEQNCIPNESKISEGSGNISGRFNSKGTVKRLLKAPGDITIEGRSGSAIRLGSTVDGFSSGISGPDRAPFVVIHNSQHPTEGVSAPQFEDVNKDGSSIYMISGHNVGIELSSFNFESYGEEVSIPDKNNFVVADIPVESPQEESLDSKDKKAEETDKIPEKKEVKSPTPATETAPIQEDEQLPDREEELFISKTEAIAVFVKDVVQYNTDIALKSRDAEGPTGEVSTDPNTTPTNKIVFPGLPPYISTDKRYQDFIKTPGVQQKLAEVCNKLGCRQTDLLVTIYAESKFDTKAVNGSTRATGLIQFMPRTAEDLGTTVQAIYNMSATQQLDLAYQFYKPKAGRFTDVYEFYSYTFVPISIGKPQNWIYQWKGRSAYTVSIQNPAIAKAAGKTPGTPLTRADFFKYVNKILTGK